MTNSKKRFKYFGKGNEFAIIYFKNLLLNIITLGLYYPWAKVERLKYHYKSTQLDTSRFSFHGTGKEVFRGFIKIYILLIIIIISIYGFQNSHPFLRMLFIALYYLIIVLLIPFAIHGTVRYRSSRSSWKGIHFKYLGHKMELFWKCITGMLLTVFTLGIYSAWFSVDIRKYVIGHLRFGNLSFDFHGKGGTLFWINLRSAILIYLTLGIYTFWYYKQTLAFYIDNTEITQNGKKVNFKINMKAGNIFNLVVVNAFLIILTFGIAIPWVTVRTFTIIFRFLEIEEGLNTSNIQQVNYDNYNDAAGDDFLDFMDIDLL